jgi:hypothetical protein
MFEAETLMGILRDWTIISKDELLGSVERMGMEVLLIRIPIQ